MENFKSSIFRYTEEDQHSYRCVNCGNPLKELYKSYSPIIQKLVECEKCKNIADTLIEFDNLYIIINIILLSKQAQRHVLYNARGKSLYKIMMILTLIESYFLWNEKSENYNYQNNNNNGTGNSDPLYLEKGFYMSTLKVVLCNVTFIIIIRIISTWSEDKLYKTKNLTLDLIRGFMLASIAKFFYLPIIIWRENISGLSRGIHLTLVIGYFLISLIYVHSTITGSSKKLSAAAILLSFIVNRYIWFNINLTV